MRGRNAELQSLGVDFENTRKLADVVEPRIKERASFDLTNRRLRNIGTLRQLILRQVGLTSCIAKRDLFHRRNINSDWNILSSIFEGFTAVSVFRAESITYEPVSPLILRRMTQDDVRDALRAAILQWRERTGDTQKTFAKKAGVEQGTISKIEDPEKTLDQLRFETVRSIVESGLDTTLSEFFLQIERQTDADTGQATNPTISTVPQLAAESEAADVSPSARLHTTVIRRTFVDVAKLLLQAGEQLHDGGGYEERRAPRRKITGARTRRSKRYRHS